MSNNKIIIKKSHFRENKKEVKQTDKHDFPHE